MSGRMKRLIYTYEQGYTTAYDEYIVEDGEIVLNMGAYSAIVLKTDRYTDVEMNETVDGVK